MEDITMMSVVPGHITIHGGRVYVSALDSGNNNNIISGNDGSKNNGGGSSNNNKK